MTSSTKRHKKRNISSLMFLKLFRGLKPDGNGSLECASLVSKVGNHEITIYASIDNGYELCIECFGFVKNGRWHQMEPTKSQLIFLESAIMKEAKRQEELFDEKERAEMPDPDFNGNYYDYYGVTPQMFI